ncbi:MAG: competence/damage-inducible protein A [Planctomycetota bacterium]|jgi:nicotinamide-nucleotide amidase
MNAIIISIGSELIHGVTLDTNAAWLAQRVGEVGITVDLQITVGDELESIVEQINRACRSAEVVIISGGLGPTEDDLTRHALASAMGVELRLDENYVSKIRHFFTVRGREMPQANVIQAMFPIGSEPIENHCGTAPGIQAQIEKAAVFVLPGVPGEMRMMFDGRVLPLLAQRAGGEAILVTTLYCFGAGESDIGSAIKDLMEPGRNPSVGTTAKQGVIGVRIYSRASSPQAAQKLMDQLADRVRQQLGTLVFGQDDPRLSQAVARLLVDRHQTVSTAESCTGGLIAKNLTDISGSSEYFLQGFITYSNQAKISLLDVPAELIARHGAVSRQVADAMAVNCRKISKSDYAISVTGIAGPTGGSPEKPVGLVYIGLADKHGCEVTEHRIGEFLDRQDIRDRAHKTALNRLRLKLLENCPST